MKTGSLLFLFFLIAPSNSVLSQEVDFTRDIRPILSDKCFHCHGNDEKTRESGLRLDVREEAVDMEAIVPGSPDDSNAWQRIISSDEDQVMPPPHTHKSLSGDEKKIIHQWIEQGATYEQHWAYRPVIKPDVALASEYESPVDALIRKLLQKESLSPVGEADRKTLIRRLSLDLTGLPPSLEDIDHFVNDRSDNAYEKLVDDLLQQDAFGERMAVFWLDLVRYADTVGYHADNHMEVSAYRDYVINAFNANKPFDEFTIEQLAGDLLPDATEEQKIASGYNRLLQTTEEGGAQAKEYIAIYAADRVRNVSGVWMGQTMGCAQCHDHKYDPITAKDFYSMSAFFADIREVPVGKRVKNLTLFTDEEKETLKTLEAELSAANQEEADFLAGSETRLKAQQLYESSLLAQSAGEDHQWQVPAFSNIEVTGAAEDAKKGAKEGAELRELDDGSLLSVGEVLPHATYSFNVAAKGKVPAIRMEVLTHESFHHKDSFNRLGGNFVLTGFQVFLGNQELPIDSVEADYQQKNYEAKNAIDGNPKTGWAVDGYLEKGRVGRRVVLFRFKEPIDLEGVEPKQLRIEMQHQSVHAQHNVDRFRISLPTTNANANPDPGELSFNGKTDLPQRLKELIELPQPQRTEEQQKRLDEMFLQQSSELKLIVEKRESIETKIKTTRDNARTMLVADALPTPRMTKIKNRGDWLDESGEEVQPAVPEFLPSNFGDEDRRLTRLDLAKWLVEPSNPLTSRTFVNRLWKVFFGRGISNNLDDLGGQGEPPTHPELLDLLASDFQQDWNVKRVAKAMVMTEAYRRSSTASSDVVESDPGNHWYARQGRWRIDAEFVRDTALRLSGFLDESQIGGRSVKPYQPEGYWQHLNFPKRKWQRDSGSKLYRKSLYTFWCRSFLHPTMLAFDAPTREECVASRARSNIPQQALVLLNDPIFVEASRGFATRMMQNEGSDRSKVALGWEEAVGRSSTEEEVELLIKLLEIQRQRFKELPEEARKLLQVGESSIPDDVDAVELAAWTQVARAMLNAYETISRH